MRLSATCVPACCGYAAFLVVLILPVIAATAAGGVIRLVTGSRTIAAWSAAASAVAMNVGLAAALYHYSTQLAGGPPEPELALRQSLGFAVVGSAVGGVVSFFLCRAMR